MYKIRQSDGAILFPDGLILECPYEHERYMEYAEWVQSGNEPEVVDVL